MKILWLVTILFSVSLTRSTKPLTNRTFSANIFNELAKKNYNVSMVLSPSSIRKMLALVFMAADGETASELYDILQLNGSNKDKVGKEFRADKKKLGNKEIQLLSASRIYLSNAYDIAFNFHQLSTKYFNAKSETIDFGSADAATKINAWVESRTNHKIKSLLSQSSRLNETKVLLIDALYFKANWKYSFKKSATKSRDFHISSQQVVTVKMMKQTAVFGYQYLQELRANAIELPYDKTNIRMLIILPDAVDGLSEVEQKLENFDLNQLKLPAKEVELQLPRFKVEFGCALKEHLSHLGIKLIFKNEGDLTGLTFEKAHLHINDVNHKSYIEVDERGTKAAAGTTAQFIQTTMDLKITFVADHPFFFAIKDDETVYFAGHVAKF